VCCVVVGWRDVSLCSEEVPIDAPVVKGYDFNAGVNYQALLASMITTGYQATSFGQAIEEIRRMARISGCTTTDSRLPADVAAERPGACARGW
jgi:deoxyhypusine synthase